MNYRDVLEMPLVTFWSYNRQINRLRAEQDQRLMRVMTAVNSPEGYEALAKTLEEEIGRATVVEKGFDEEQFKRLAQKFNKGVS